jgi:hypothetical protein
MMPNELDPICNQWYSHIDKGQRFFVAATDEATGTVEIQHFDGDLEEISVEEWRLWDIELSVAPENWAGPLDVGNVDDLGTEVTDTTGADWTDPLTELPPAKQE